MDSVLNLNERPAQVDLNECYELRKAKSYKNTITYIPGQMEKERSSVECLAKPYKIPPQARASTLYSAIDDPAARNLQDEMIGEKEKRRRTSRPCLK
ncbi:uncharacterized protein Bfra_003132 [Botrytis fragariae]|uniref:Uncharacterized protein n=1 Tax=Botrytis fragariae TaxID=1964551 RepID=A0A8H6AZX6_9HELO|nr:uncharacterized protein Bfra_003132 [Botrytis fragariae]KAF5876726.1 hypothetical protein Bfra_003132 [Botrytis fragariae]